MAGRIALVTGAGSGIGRSAALALLADGFYVVLAGRRQVRLEQTAALAREAATGPDPVGRALVVPADVTDPASVEALFGRTREEFGRLDVLFNNAGVAAPPTPLEDLSLEAWQAVVDVNLTGTFLCIRAAFRLMKAQDPRGGRIINNGSLSAHAPRPDSAPYTATKHGVSGLTRATALEGRRYDIACGQIDVGNVATELSETVVEPTRQADGTRTAEPRMDLEHVGRAVLHMARLPLDANVLFMTIMATQMPFVGRG